MKKTLATIAAGVASLPALAQEAGGYSVPAGVQTAMDDLGDAAGVLAGAVAPTLGEIVLAFIGVALILWVGRFLWRKANGRS